MERIYAGKVGDLKEGEKKVVRAGNRDVIVAKVEDKVYAVDGMCTHMRAPLSAGKIIDKTIRCRMHGAVFDLETGNAVMRPAGATDLKTYPVVIEGEDIYFEFEA
jgi:3-phenylpropionate/trans-cinnamate dioxygenase ferredoxin subunit